MNERLTLVTVFNENDLKKITNCINNSSIALCKVPFGKKVDNCRFEVDTLPYHITVFTWSTKKIDEVKDFLSTISFSPSQVVVESIKIINGNEDSFELRFTISRTSELKRLQKQILNHFSSNYFNPLTYNFHISIHASKNETEIHELEKELNENFIPFTLTIDTLKLFSIYPAILIEEYHSNI